MWILVLCWRKEANEFTDKMISYFFRNMKPSPDIFSEVLRDICFPYVISMG